MKITTLNEVIKQTRNKRVVWTNGCFVLLHAGHVHYLEQAKSLGDVLVVGLNSDKSLRRIKHKKSQIQDEYFRAKALAGLEAVDYIVLFNDKSPYKLIKKLKPDVFVKGNDYTLSTLNQKEVEAVGNNEIRFIENLKGISTSIIITKILQNYV